MDLVREPRKPLSCTWCLRGPGRQTHGGRPPPCAVGEGDASCDASAPALCPAVSDTVEGEGPPKGPSPDSHVPAGSSGRLAAAFKFIANLK